MHHNDSQCLHIFKTANFESDDLLSRVVDFCSKHAWSQLACISALNEKQKLPWQFALDLKSTAVVACHSSCLASNRGVTCTMHLFECLSGSARRMQIPR